MKKMYRMVNKGKSNKRLGNKQIKIKRKAFNLKLVYLVLRIACTKDNQDSQKTLRIQDKNRIICII